MGSFGWALAAFVLIHIGVSATGARAALVGRLGEGLYRGLFSLISLALLVWMIVALGAVRADPFDPLNEALWAPPAWLRWPGVIVAFVGVATPGPTSAGFEKRALAQAEPARGIHRITRHPFLWGVALWGAGHLMVNGERFALMLFGALTLMVILGSRSIDRKGRARDPVGFAGYEDVTSNVPFMAITQGRNRLRLGEIGWRGLAGLAVALMLAMAHGRLFGAPVISTWP